MVNTNSSCITVCTTREEAEQRVREVIDAGFSITQLSIAGRGLVAGKNIVKSSRNPGGEAACRDGGAAGQPADTNWLSFEIPGLGLLMVNGPLASILVESHHDPLMADSLTLLGTALHSIGVPIGEIMRYEREIRRENYILVAHGSQRTVEAISDILGNDMSLDVVVHISR